MRDFTSPAKASPSKAAITALAAVALVLLAVGSARGAGVGGAGGTPEVPIYSIEGYLDEAPKDVEVIDRVTLTREGESERELLVTRYREAGEASLLTHLSKKSDMPWNVQGDAAELDRLFEAEKGARVDGVFQRHGANPRLLIHSLAAPEGPAGS